MWHPWQTFANNCSPVDSVNLNPVLSEPCERRSSSACAAGDAHPINARLAAAKAPVNNAKLNFADSTRLIGIASNPDDAVMQPLDGIEGGKYRAVLPGRKEGGG